MKVKAVMMTINIDIMSALTGLSQKEMAPLYLITSGRIGVLFGRDVWKKGCSWYLSHQR